MYFLNTKTGGKTFVDVDTKPLSDDEVISQTNFIEWLVENKKKFNIDLQLVTDSSAEGT